MRRDLPSSFDRRQAEDAFQVHAALARCEAAVPTLTDNPQWTILRQDAFERFAIAFEGL